jgi:hypothetical protein
MIIKILGILDIIVGICFWLFGIFNIIPSEFIFILGLFLLVKGIIFITGFSIASFFDIFLGILIIISTSFNLPKIIIILISLFIVQKGIFSLIS